MAAILHNDVFDSGLSQLDTEADRLDICSTQPSTYTEAITTYTLGNKTACSVGAPEDGDASGRKVRVAAITDGTVSGTGTAAYWSLVDVSETKLLAAGPLASSQGVTSGNTFTLAAFDIEIPDPS
jgi:hypothetical protein